MTKISCGLYIGENLTLETVVQFLESRYPLSLAESWDNVGLLVGDRTMPMERVMTCLTVTPEICREAVEQKADLIVTHHPFPFHAVRQITTATSDGAMLLQLIRAGVAVYSAHTAFDSAQEGINRQIATKLELHEVTTLYPPHELAIDENEIGTGRVGSLSQAVRLIELVEKVAAMFRLEVLPYVGEPDTLVQRVAIGCGAAGDFLEQVKMQHADVFFVGEMRFHQYLEALANGIALILPGHYASERFAVEQMADVIAGHFRTSGQMLTVWASRDERDPLRFWKK